MSNLTTLPKGDSAWLLRKSIQRIMQQVSVLETNIGSSTTGNSSDTQIIFNDAGTLRGDSGLTYNKTTDLLSVGSATITGDLTVRTNQLIANANGVGVGTAPSAWSGIGPALQVEQASLLSESSNQLYLTANGYFAGGQWNYINTASADQYYQIAGSHVWRSAISGTAGTAIGWSTLMTLNSTGLGVGVSPSYKLDVLGSATISGRFKTSGALNALYLEDGGTTPGSLYIGTSGDTFRIITGSNVRMNVDVNGNVGIGVAPSAGKGCLQLSSGINFPATQVASSDPNTLDDYEEGTWTGTLTGTTTNPTTPVTATGRYTKIGRQVSIQIQFTNVDTTGASGQIKVTGAPFINNSSVSAIGPVLLSSIGTFTGSPAAFIQVNTTEIELYASSSGGSAGLVTHNAGTSRSLYINLTYTV